MPIYEYVCISCKKRFSFLVLRAGEEKDAVCPSCGSGKISRQLSRFAVGKGGQAGGTEGFGSEGDGGDGPDSQADPGADSGGDGDADAWGGDE